MQTRGSSDEELSGWFAGRIPADWFVGTPQVSFDRDEILVIGTLSDPELPSDATAEGAAAARVARIDGFREDTREHRMRIAQEAQHRFGRRVSWGAECADARKLFTTVSVPVMTRLRLADRAVLDVLEDAGVARSRSEALAWCVRMVGANLDEWLRDLRTAFEHVERVRARGPRNEE